MYTSDIRITNITHYVLTRILIGAYLIFIYHSWNRNFDKNKR